jgi:hypothetical protein
MNIQRFRQRFGNWSMEPKPLSHCSRFPATRLLGCVIVLAAAYCFLFPVPAVYAADWQMRVSASLPFLSAEGGRAAQSVTIGTRATAQDTFDNASDTKALGSAVVAVYAYHPEYAPEHQVLARDIRADHYPQSWALVVSSNQNGQPITLGWTLPPSQPGSCLGVSLNLTDETTGATVDLLQPSYVYTNTVATPRKFTVTATQTVQSPPPAPLNFFSPHSDSTSVRLSWSGVKKSLIVGYNVYRKDPGTMSAVRRTASPIPSPTYLDNGLVPGAYVYFVTAVTATGCESPPTTTVTATVTPNLRPSHPSLKPRP